MNKLIYFFLVIMLGLFIIYVFRNEEVDVSNDNINSLNFNYENTLILAELENELVAQKKHHIHIESNEAQDYTTLFPDLYTVYDVPDSMDKGRRIAYLTFDDGPSSNTFEILDILDEMNVSATFFIVGSAITKEGEGALRRIVNEGHTIGIHSYSHLCNEIYCSVERFLNDYNMVYQQIYDITGKRANIYRFPWGSNNSYSKGIKDDLINEMERRGFACYDWNVDSNDSVGRPTEYSIRRNVEKDLETRDYPIVLMHDSGNNKLTVKTLPGIIKIIRDKGYEFDTLDNREPYLFEW
ncbi:MAG: polysaccharide deacetylase [Anaerolineaceae bacterium]|nr:MAG: polysaccharide deacetylase [Anaerolineaceae bacterium]